jgi:hypothetical protein
MPDQIMTAIVDALAGKTADAMFGGGKEAFTALVSLIRERFSHDDKARKALESALDSHTSQKSTELGTTATLPCELAQNNPSYTSRALIRMMQNGVARRLWLNSLT